ncbi:2OG-Fe(II) oxygenase [Sphingomonas donggukensis]|uniref:2OG-Fe(II) oxygenase n=1 Tax=Sphingomonas donggukensis TaxID=2949093 RepID=A0ABY4TWH1_9SPHN|nr:2OG-Fe(II) oxygenase [Sphingomonas donggukensis]URW76051.1 2OG-Fe(II) oxygenase [Sphingomonas donggukensis]
MTDARSPEPSIAAREPAEPASPPPCHLLDLVAEGLLPAGWEETVAALADAPECLTLSRTDQWSFSVVQGDVVCDRLGWLWELYHGVLRDFATRACSRPVVAAARLRSTMTLNILSGPGASSDWHRDNNAVTGLFFATARTDGGGDLLFRDAAGRESAVTPRPGLFVCFPGAIEHRVAPIADGRRLSLPMVYHDSTADQPPAYGDDVYVL